MTSPLVGMRGMSAKASLTASYLINKCVVASRIVFLAVTLTICTRRMRGEVIIWVISNRNSLSAARQSARRPRSHSARVQSPVAQHRQLALSFRLSLVATHSMRCSAHRQRARHFHKLAQRRSVDSGELLYYDFSRTKSLFQRALPCREMSVECLLLVLRRTSGAYRRNALLEFFTSSKRRKFLEFSKRFLYSSRAAQSAPQAHAFPMRLSESVENVLEAVLHSLSPQSDAAYGRGQSRERSVSIL